MHILLTGEIMKKIMYLLAIIFLLVGCTNDTTFNYDFNTSDHGWIFGQVNYDTTLSENELMLNGGYLEEHELFNSNLNSLWIIGNNDKSNITFYVYKQLSGLEKNTEYEVDFNISIITPFSSNMNKENNLGIDSNAYLLFSSDEPATNTIDGKVLFTKNTNNFLESKSIYLNNMSSNEESVYSENLYNIDKNISTNFTSNEYGNIYAIVYIETSGDGLHAYAINKIDISVTKKAKLN